MFRQIVRLALRDWRHEFALSICAVLALASMLTPLMVLHGVHQGTIEHLRENLMQDPAVLVLMPVGAKGAGFTPDFLEEIARQPECVFCIGRTRSVASEIQLRAQNGKDAILTLEATAEGDPLLTRYGVSLPGNSSGDMAVILSAPVARTLEARVGDRLKAALSRRLATGAFQRREIAFVVSGILPPVATGMDTGFVSMETLFALQDYRDGIRSELLKTEGSEPPEIRHFESFRAYVQSLDDVEKLESWLNEHNVMASTRSRDIANIRNIDGTLTSIILVITATAGVGFFAFMLSSVRASVRRKWKMLGMLRLLGFSQGNILMYPLVQALVTGILGTLLAFALYAGVAVSIDLLLADRLQGQGICSFPLTDFCLVFGLVQILVSAASFDVAYKASRIDPSIVIREM